MTPFFMDGVQLPQGYRATTRTQFTFYHSENNWKKKKKKMITIKNAQLFYLRNSKKATVALVK